MIVDCAQKYNSRKKRELTVRKDTILMKMTDCAQKYNFCKIYTVDCAQKYNPHKIKHAVQSYMSQYQFSPTTLGLYNLLVTKINTTQDTYVQCKRTFTGITAVDSTWRKGRYSRLMFGVCIPRRGQVFVNF